MFTCRPVAQNSLLLYSSSYPLNQHHHITNTTTMHDPTYHEWLLTEDSYSPLWRLEQAWQSMMPAAGNPPTQLQEAYRRCPEQSLDSARSLVTSYLYGVHQPPKHQLLTPAQEATVRYVQAWHQLTGQAVTPEMWRSWHHSKKTVRAAENLALRYFQRDNDYNPPRPAPNATLHLLGGGGSQEALTIYTGGPLSTALRSLLVAEPALRR